MTLPGSLLDQFAGPRGYRRWNSSSITATPHPAATRPADARQPHPLGLAGVDLDAWIRGTFLSEQEIHTAWTLSSFLQAQGLAGRDKVTLLSAKSLAGASLWTKQNFEESLGKSEAIGIKIVIGEKVKLANYRSPKDTRQDRVFLAFQQKGLDGPDKTKLSILRRRLRCGGDHNPARNAALRLYAVHTLRRVRDWILARDELSHAAVGGTV